MSTIVIGPFSNSGIRDWPGTHFARLIALLLDRIEPAWTIDVIGTATHNLRANEIVRAFPAPRVANRCGHQSWAQMVATVKSAACAVVNNSGVAHLAGHFGVPTVEIFAGTHQRREWRALGPNVTLITRAIGCAPCQLDHGQTSPYDKACLREIGPEVVADAVFRSMEKAERLGRQRFARMSEEAAECSIG